MKPFELTVYPRTDAGDYTDPEHGYRIHQEDVEVFVYQKRLTNAELAAEYWRYESNIWEALAKMPEPPTLEAVMAGEEWNRRAEIVERFATLPSYDEVPE